MLQGISVLRFSLYCVLSYSVEVFLYAFLWAAVTWFNFSLCVCSLSSLHFASLQLHILNFRGFLLVTLWCICFIAVQFSSHIILVLTSGLSWDTPLSFLYLHLLKLTSLSICMFAGMSGMACIWYKIGTWCCHILWMFLNEIIDDNFYKAKFKLWLILYQ